MRKYLIPVLLIGFWGCEDNKSEDNNSTPTSESLIVTGDYQGNFNILLTVSQSQDGSIDGVQAWESMDLENNLTFTLMDSTARFSAEVDSLYAWYVTNQIGTSYYNAENECNLSMTIDSLNLYFLGESNFMIIEYDNLDSSKTVTVNGTLSYDWSSSPYGCPE